jgi:hypothetical protein
MSAETKQDGWRQTIISLDERRPHLVISGKLSTHIVPVVMLEKMVRGDLNISDIDDAQDIFEKITDEWLGYVGAK